MAIRMGIRQIREQIGERVNAAHYLDEPTIIERNGQPFAVLVPYSQWEEQQNAQDGPGLTPP